MIISDYWDGIVLKQTNLPPLDFVMGFCHSVHKGFYCPPHYHPFLEIVYHPSGRGTTTVSDDLEICFREGDAIIYPTGEPHDQAVSHTGEDWCIQIAAPLKNESTNALHIPAISSPTLIENIRSLSHENSHSPQLPPSILNLKASAVLLELIYVAHTRQESGTLPPVEKHIIEAERYIAEHFSKINSLQEVATGIGIGYDHLRHLFKTLRKKSLVRYLNEVRIERAKALLVHSRLPLKQIASMCGFKDEYYFSTVFRNFTHTPPRRFREKSGKSVK